MSAPHAPSAGPTGPRTAEGKAISSQNATSHGLSTPRTVLAHENQSDFDGLAADLQNEFQPNTPHETFLVSHMADARWKLDRAKNIESAIFDEMLRDDKTNPPATPEARMANAMLARGGDALARIQRYITVLERSYYKAHRELLQSRKLQNEVRRKAAAADFKAQEAELLAFINAPLPSSDPKPAICSFMTPVKTSPAQPPTQPTTPVRSAPANITSKQRPILGGSARFITGPGR